MRQKKIKTADINMLYRQLAAMTGSGLSVAESIRTLAEESDGSPVMTLVTALRQEMEKGASAGDAMSRHLPQVGGIASSLFDQDAKAVSVFFRDLAEFSEKKESLRKSLLLSFTYPALVALVLLLVLSLLMVVVVPMLAEIFSGSGQLLPLPTRIVLALSNFLKGWGGLAFLIALAAGATAVIRNKGMAYGLLDRVPFLGTLSRKITGAEFLRSLAFSARVDIPPAKAAQKAASGLTNDFHAKRLGDAVSGSVSVEQLVGQLKALGLVPPMIGHTLRAAERSNTLVSGLDESARFLEYDAEKAYERFVVLLYPLMVIVIGAAVGFCVVAMYMPIFQLGSAA
jgi:type II secretory pathway component PulF